MWHVCFYYCVYSCYPLSAWDSIDISLGSCIFVWSSSSMFIVSLSLFLCQNWKTWITPVYDVYMAISTSQIMLVMESYGKFYGNLMIFEVPVMEPALVGSPTLQRCVLHAPRLQTHWHPELPQKGSFGILEYEPLQNYIYIGDAWWCILRTMD